VIPKALDVGDYLLSPEIVIERKSIPDLIGSLKSGRLHSQAEGLCRQYKNPILMIEFDEDKSFALLVGDCSLCSLFITMLTESIFATVNRRLRTRRLV